MTLSIVRTVPTAPELERRAEAIANEVADPVGWAWGCAFHHAIDLLFYARGFRTTTRCLSNYTPNEIERRVEAVLEKHGIKRGMRA